MSIQVPDRCDLQVGDVVDGSGNSYRIVKKLGEGTFGIVFKVEDNQGRICAMKILKLWTVPSDVYKGLRDRFVMEFETGKIKSDFLAHSYSYGDIKNNPFFVMEYCPNGDLRKYAKNKRVDYFRIGADVLRGLRDLHNEGKVHRDLKPENVLLRKDYSAVLTDFGISGDQNKRMTERGIAGKPKQLFGTYPYMPPEQVNPPRGGKATVLPTTDIFSFGVMMYEMMVGKLPFGELNRDEQLNDYLDNGKKGIWDKDALKDVADSKVWTSIIERCLDPDYKTRISSAIEILNMLPRYQFSKTPPLQPPVFPTYMCERNGILLRIMQGEGYGKVYKLPEFISERHRVITMGRTDDSIRNDIDIDDRECLVSRCHCTFEYDGVGRQWVIRDGQWRKVCPIALRQGGCMGCTAFCQPFDMRSEWRNSVNGTYVNSKEVGKNGEVLHPGDIITIGDVKLRVEGY